MFKWFKKKQTESSISNPSTVPENIPKEEEQLCLKNLSDNDEAKRISAIKTFAYYRSKSAVEPLIKLLRSLAPNRKNADERLEIVVAMGKIGDSRFINPLIDCLDDMSEPLGSNEAYRVCTNASYSLGEIGDSRAIAPLSSILHNTNIDYYRRSIAAKALALIDDKNSLKALKAVIHDSNETVRKTALSLIKNMEKA